MFSSNILDIRIYFYLLIKQNGIFNVVPSLTAARFFRSLSIGTLITSRKFDFGINAIWSALGSTEVEKNAD